MKKKSRNLNNILMIKHYSGKGGGDIHIEIISKLWKKKGIKVDKFFNENNDLNLFPILSIYSIIKNIKNLLPLKNNPDIILSSSPYLPDLLSSVYIYFKYHKPVIIYFHHLPPKLYWYPFKRGLISSIFNYFYMNTVLIISKILNFSIMLDQPQAYKLGTISVMKDDDAINENFKIDYNKVSSDFYFDIGFLARFQKSKGIFDFINAISKVIKKFPNLKVFIAGHSLDLKLENNIKNKISKLGLKSNITLFTNIDNVAKIKLLKNLKLYVFPSYVEGWALSVMEAAYANVPIIVYSLPAYSYLKNNYFSVKPGNIKDLANKIEYVLLNYNEAKLIACEAGRIVKKYNYEKIASDQLNFFESLINQNIT